MAEKRRKSQWSQWLDRQWSDPFVAPLMVLRTAILLLVSVYVLLPVFFIVFVTLVVIALAWPLELQALWKSLATVSQDWWLLHLLFLGCCLLIGWCLYIVRQMLRPLYWPSRDCFWGCRLLGGPWRSTRQLARWKHRSCWGSIYVIVRGIDNFMIGRKERTAANLSCLETEKGA